MASEFADLYKARGKHSLENRQSERRTRLLKVQKLQRNELIDDLRGIQEIVKNLKGPRHAKRPNNNQLQLSEWLIEKPDDWSDWYLVPCPKGTRCLVVAHNGRTESFNKHGKFLKHFRSDLPGDSTNKRATTILDCIFISSTKEYHVLDVLAYRNQDMVNCDAEFRFFWIASKIIDEQLDVVTVSNEHTFKMIERIDCADEMAIGERLSTYPIWEKNLPELDGFLFYHKESSYVHGKTPLVGWLFAFMIPEVLAVPYMNPAYLNELPVGYVDYSTYIREFDENAAKQGRSRRRRTNGDKMDTEAVDDPDSMDAVVAAERCLEMEESYDEREEFDVDV